MGKPEEDVEEANRHLKDGKKPAPGADGLIVPADEEQAEPKQALHPIHCQEC